MPSLARYWINQPSTLQPNHKLHGVRVLVDINKNDAYCRVYFVDGAVISQEIAVLSLAEGWPITSKHNEL